MSDQPPSNQHGPVKAATADLGRRVALAREVVDEPFRPPARRLLLGELSQLAEPIKRLFRRIDLPQTQNPRTVMILPGFATHPVRMKYMAKQLEKAGHRTKRWGLGFNMGPTPENLAVLEQRLLDMHEKYDEQVVLVGWSLGGLFARELAKRQPQAVAKVITMGTPFSGNPRDNNVWRVYQFVAGHAVDQPPVDNPIAPKPPVETVALWSPRDGIIAARCACGREDERDRAIALRCTHMGFPYSKESITAVSRELETS